MDSSVGFDLEALGGNGVGCISAMVLSWVPPFIPSTNTKYTVLVAWERTLIPQKWLQVQGQGVVVM